MDFEIRVKQNKTRHVPNPLTTPIKTYRVTRFSLFVFFIKKKTGYETAVFTNLFLLFHAYFVTALISKNTICVTKVLLIVNLKQLQSNILFYLFCFLTYFHCFFYSSALFRSLVK